MLKSYHLLALAVNLIKIRIRNQDAGIQSQTNLIGIRIQNLLTNPITLTRRNTPPNQANLIRLLLAEEGAGVVEAVILRVITDSQTTKQMIDQLAQKRKMIIPDK